MNLAILTRAGFPVPPGFIVSTTAYRSFIAANLLQAIILRRIEGLSPYDLEGLEAASQEILTHIQRAAIPAISVIRQQPQNHAPTDRVGIYIQ